MRLGRIALAAALLLGAADPALAQSASPTTSTTVRPPAPPPGTAPESISGAIPLPGTTTGSTGTSTTTTATSAAVAATSAGVAASVAPAPAFSPSNPTTDIMLLATPPSVNLSSLQPSVRAPSGTTGTGTGTTGFGAAAAATPSPASTARSAPALFLCAPGGGGAEMALFVGTDIACAP